MTGPADTESGIPAAILHIGAGTGERSNGTSPGPKRRVVLVDADSANAEQLAARAQDNPDVEVLCAAVSGDRSARTFFGCNLPIANGLNTPTGLRKLYPGLKVIEQRTIQTRAISDLVTELRLSNPGRNELILDVCGEERSILNELARTRLIDLFGNIQVRCGVESLFESAMTVDQTTEWLSEFGFELSQKHDHIDPDQPMLIFRRSAVREHVARLLAELESVRGSQAAEQSRVENLCARIDELSRESGHRAERISQLEQELEASRARFEETMRVCGELEQKVQERTTQLEEQLGLLDESRRDAADAGNRQRLLDEELVRAEAQLALITDVLLKDKLA